MFNVRDKLQSQEKKSSNQSNPQTETHPSKFSEIVVNVNYAIKRRRNMVMKTWCSFAAHCESHSIKLFHWISPHYSTIIIIIHSWSWHHFVIVYCVLCTDCAIAIITFKPYIRYIKFVRTNCVYLNIVSVLYDERCQCISNRNTEQFSFQHQNQFVCMK